MGVKQNTISNWETARQEPSISNLLKIANFFGVRVEYLIGFDRFTKYAFLFYEVIAKTNGIKKRQSFDLEFSEFKQLFNNFTNLSTHCDYTQSMMENKDKLENCLRANQKHIQSFNVILVQNFLNYKNDINKLILKYIFELELPEGIIDIEMVDWLEFNLQFIDFYKQIRKIDFKNT